MHGAIVQRNGALFVCQERFLHDSREPQSPWGSFSCGTTTAAGPGVLFQGEGEAASAVMSFAGRLVLRRNENCCPLSQENQDNCILKGLKLTQFKGLKLTQSSKSSSCLDGKFTPLLFHVHLSAFALCHLCKPQQNPVRNKPEDASRTDSSLGQSPMEDFGDGEDGGGTGAVRHHILTNCDGEQAAPRLWTLQRTNSLGQMKQKGATKEL